MTCRGDLLIYTEEVGIGVFHLSHIRETSDYLCTSNACDVPGEVMVSETASSSISFIPPSLSAWVITWPAEDIWMWPFLYFSLYTPERQEICKCWKTLQQYCKKMLIGFSRMQWEKFLGLKRSPFWILDERRGSWRFSGIMLEFCWSTFMEMMTHPSTGPHLFVLV